MAQSLFRQSFLNDSLDIENKMLPKQIQLSTGVTIRVLKRGVVEVIPSKVHEDSKAIVLSAGIHGDETAPMELLDQLVDDILNQKLSVQHRILFLLGHVEAAIQHTRFIQENLNRLFDHKAHDSSVETKIANDIKQSITEFFQDTAESQRWHLDLHCAIRGSKHYTFAVSPKVAKANNRSRELIEFLQKAQIEAVLLSNSPASTLSWYSADKFSAQTLTVELGKVARFGHNDLGLISDFSQALYGLLANNLDRFAPSPLITYRVTQCIKRHTEDFDFTFSDDVENFTQFEHGQVLGHDGDKLLFAKVDQEAVVFPNKKVALGQRAALMVTPVETRYQDDQLVYD
ncbi:succinylglutamate desuccinylase [Vibrio sp. TH_r3]|uniref:succinylglutamate desuccinylase n=1 Tax=Vibrio sp. TH_r3 TaxID=3082084 RepID=UPI0029546825|nr:succinylglutamate desuccinylase [Vibrio sp. TH_r3]MDV7104332.1 succinylglutamate desuccinylase [Vibrio sp. TH_r3]